MSIVNRTLIIAGVLMGILTGAIIIMTFWCYAQHAGITLMPTPKVITVYPEYQPMKIYITIDDWGAYYQAQLERIEVTLEGESDPIQCEILNREREDLGRKLDRYRQLDKITPDRKKNYDFQEKVWTF